MPNLNNYQLSSLGLGASLKANLILAECQTRLEECGKLSLFGARVQTSLVCRMTSRAGKRLTKKTSSSNFVYDTNGKLLLGYFQLQCLHTILNILSLDRMATMYISVSIADNSHEITVVYDYDGVRKGINEAWKLTDRAGNQLDMSELAVNDKVMCL